MAIIFASLLSFACSSAPKRPPENTAVRNTAASQLLIANQAANQGRYEDALLFLDEARRLAHSADDPKLRIETTISRANIFFSMGDSVEAFRLWEEAAAEADASNEKELAALSRIYMMRAMLTLMENNQPASINGENLSAEELRARIEREMGIFPRGSHSQAAAFISLGMAERHLERWPQAESAIRNALVILERANYLEDAAYGWYLIGSIRSLAGNYDASLQALRTAIEFDRRAENSYGLASSWQAMGEVQRKAGRPGESRAAWQRAIDIYRAIGLNDRAERLEAQL